MTIFTKPGADVASPVDDAGNPRRVSNLDMQVWMTEVERAALARAVGAVTFGTKEEADLALTYDAWTTAWVLTGDDAGWYTKFGASGTGAWVRKGDLPYSYIKATNAGAGTANAIIATTATPIPSADGGALIALPIVADTTASPVTVAFNGGTALTIKSNSGNDIAAGGLTAGMIVAGYVAADGTTFRLLSDADVSAVAAAAEAAAQAAQDAQAAAEAAAAGVNLPSVALTDKGKALFVKPDGTGYNVEHLFWLADIRLFGAIADGDIANAAVNAQAARDAIDSAGVAIIPSSTDGFHFGTETFDLQNGQFIIGAGGSPLVKATMTGDFISIFGKAASMERHGVQNIIFDGEGSSPGSMAIRLRNDQSIIYGCELDDLRFQHCYGGISDYPETDVAVTNAFSTTSGSTQVDIDVPAHGWTVAKVVTISGVGTIGGLAIDGAWTVNVVDADTLRFNHTSTASSTVSATGSGNLHFENGYIFDTKITRIHARYCHGTVLRLLWTQGQIWIDNIHIPLADGAGAENGDPAPRHTFPAVDLRDFVGLEIGRINVVGQGLAPERACTFTTGTPGVVNRASHSLFAQQPIQFTTTGTLPTGLSTGTNYYVSLPTEDGFNISATPGGAAINLTDTGTGTHTYTTAVWVQQAIGIQIIGTNRSTDFLWVNGMLRAEACNGTGIVMTDLTFVRGVHVEAFGCRGHGIQIIRGDRMQFANLYGRGAGDQLAAASTGDAIHISDSTNIQAAMWGAETAARDGLRLENTTDCSFHIGKTSLNGGVGVNEVGTSDRNTFRDTQESASSTHTLIGPASRWLGGMTGSARRPQTGWACKAHRNAVDTGGIATATWTQVPFATEEFDFEGTYNTTNSRVTPKAGPTRIRAQIQVTTGVVDGQPLTIALRKNGSATAVAEHQVVPGSASPMSLLVEWTGVAAAGDYFEVWVYLAGAGNKVISGATRYTFFEGMAL